MSFKISALAVLVSCSLCGSVAQGASFTQATNNANAPQIDWNSTNIWLPKITTPVSSANDYYTTNIGGTSATQFGVTWSGTLRVMSQNGTSGGGSYDGTPIGVTNTFNGGSLVVIAGSSVLTKQMSNQVVAGNIVLNGGNIRWSENSGNGLSLLGFMDGTITVATNSYIMMCNQNSLSNSVLQINSALKCTNPYGSNTLYLLSGKGDGSGPWTNRVFRLSGPVSNFFGTISLGNGHSSALNEILEFGYDVNCPGSLQILGANNAIKLHQNCAFTNVVINGTSLSPGTHTYDELKASFPDNFLPGGSGTITVQPYGALLTPPVIQVQPSPTSVGLFAGKSVQFTSGASVGASGTISIQWLKNGAPYGDVLSGTGGLTNTLAFSSLTVADSGTYTLRAWNSIGAVTSSTVTLTVVPMDTYATAVCAQNPVAFYQMNENGDASAGGLVAFDNWNGLNGTYGTMAQPGAAGPRSSDGFSGFGDANQAANLPGYPGTQSWMSAPAWNLNTNTVTLTAWINPSWTFNNQSLLFCRAGGTSAGLLFTTNNAHLGYLWNGDVLTSGWDSGIAVPWGQWSMVALVVTPTDATIYLMNTSGILSSKHVYMHGPQSFSGTTLLGGDPNDTVGNFLYQGAMDNVAVFNKALSRSEMLALYQVAAGQTGYAPLVGELSSQTVYEGQKVTMTIAADGNEAPTYRWQSAPAGSGNFTDINDNTKFSGTKTATLVINNVTTAEALDYQVIVSNSHGSVTSHVATLSVLTASAAQNITLSVQEAFGEDWDTLSRWSDGQAASVSAPQNQANTYTILPGARLRTPANQAYAVFPGNVLTNSGNGVWTVPSGATIGELGFKALTPGGVTFKKLVLNGGQINNAGGVNGNGIAQFFGEIEVLANSPIYNDNASERGYQINSWLTGNGTIEYHGYNQTAFQTNYKCTMNITGTSNTFSGTWNVVMGTLLGSGVNSLGTNTITVGAQGALETAYDINNVASDLILNGRMFLHQNDTFRNVLVNGTTLATGIHSFAELNAAYPTNFPATWTLQDGSTVSQGSGSITVLGSAPQITVQPKPLALYPGQQAVFTATAICGVPMSYQWRMNGQNISDSGTRSGSSTNTLVISGVAQGDAGNYDLVVNSSLGSVTSSIVALEILTPGPATHITLNYGGSPIVQPVSSNWDATNSWSDGRPASVSVYANPGSTYEVVVGSRLRSPESAAYAAFPGDELMVSGSGVFESGTLNAVGELRFKHALVGTNYYKKLIMNGGQLNNGGPAGSAANDTINDVVVLEGQMEIRAAASIYVDSTSYNCRSVQIGSWLTGAAPILWHDFDGSLPGTSLRVSGTSNTFSGQWIIDQGALLGAGVNSLGTNDIMVGTNGLSAAVETLYDLNNPNGSLVLGANGKVYLHQNLKFKSVTINGVQLANGTYTFQQLNTAYPSAFPASWTQLFGSTANTGSGSITVGDVAVPSTNATISKVVLNGNSLEVHGTNNNVPNTAFHYVVLTSTNVALPLDSWTPMVTNGFSSDGTFNYSLPVDAGQPRLFLNVKIVP